MITSIDPAHLKPLRRGPIGYRRREVASHFQPAMLVACLVLVACVLMIGISL